MDALATVPHLGTIIKQQQCHIPDGTAELRATVKDLNYVWVAIPIESPDCPQQKQDGSWKRTVNCHELNKVMTQTSAAMSGTVSSLEQINRASGTWYTAINTAIELSLG